MARVMRAEQEMDELHNEGKKFLKEITILLFQNAGIAVHSAVFWLKKARTSIEYRRKRAVLQEEQNAFLQFQN